MQTKITNPLQAATLAARARTGIPGLSVTVKAGKFCLVNVTYKGQRGRGVSTVEPLSDWLAGHQVLDALDTFKPSIDR